MPHPDELEALQKLSAEVEQLNPSASPPGVIDELKRSISDRESDLVKDIAQAKMRREQKVLNKTRFDELTDAQKLDRMREVIKDMERQLQFLRDEIQTLRQGHRLMGKHHHADGKVLVAASDARQDVDPTCGQAAKVAGWF